MWDDNEESPFGGDGFGGRGGFDKPSLAGSTALDDWNTPLPAPSEPEPAAGAWFNAERPFDDGHNGDAAGGGRAGDKRLGGFGANEGERNLTWEQVLERDRVNRQAKWDALPKVNKGFYTVHPEVACLSEQGVKDVLRNHQNLTITDESNKCKSLPRPVYKFEHCWEKHPEILSSLTSAGFALPTPIQCGLWPAILSGHDCVGIAQTGSGKTVAFLLPAFVHVHNQADRAEGSSSSTAAAVRAPHVLVLTPTRELALQIDKEVAKYSYKAMRSVCIYGGGDRQRQMHKCRGGVDIVIATPGRLNDLVEEGVIRLECFTYVVLDEADRMLDMGFEPQIREVLAGTRPDRHTVMTSATWPPLVRKLAAKYMRDPLHVVVGTLDLTACRDVQQIVEIVEDSPAAKFDRVMFYVGNMAADAKILIFVGKKRIVESLAERIRSSVAEMKCDPPLRVQTIHGDRMQCEREHALASFKKGTCRALVATDVASRGLDVVDISIVLNYDMSNNVDEYVHRIGRTGRAGRPGLAVTLFTKYDWAKAPELCVILGKNKQQVPSKLRAMADRYSEKQSEEQLRPGGGPSRGRGARRGGDSFGYGGGGGGQGPPVADFGYSEDPFAGGF